MTRRRSPADRRDRAGLAPSIDLLVTGHTHLPYTCDIPDPAGRSRWVTSASSFDRVITETELQLDRRTRDVVRSSVTSRNHAVTRDVPADPAQTATIARWSDLSAPVADRPVGSITGAVTRSASRDTESSLADLIADAQLVAGGRGRRHRHLRRGVHGPSPSATCSCP